MHPPLPRRFVLKLMDPRFFGISNYYTVSRSYEMPWNGTLTARFNDGLRNVRAGGWPNFWTRLGAANDVGIFDRNYELYDPDYYNDDYKDCPMIDWAREMDNWDALLRSMETEVRAYRIARALQGSTIPRMYGTCTVVVDPNLEPLLSTIPGICLQYIDGTLDRLKPGVDVSEPEAERISQGLLSTARRLRDIRVMHDDICPRNVIVRLHDLDHPVLIDFGLALIGDLDEHMNEWSEVRQIRRLLGVWGWHNPSPWTGMMIHSVHDLNGYAWANSNISGMRPDWRDQQYERIVDRPPDVIKVDKSGKEHQWEQLRWRVRPGVKTADADEDWKC